MEIKKGTIKRQIAKLEIREFEIGNIITDALLQKGFDLVVEPIVDNMKMSIGESITIYRIEQR